MIGIPLRATLAACLLAGVTVALAPSAAAIPPWFIIEVQNDFTIYPGEFGQWSAACPSNMATITGGVGGSVGTSTPSGVAVQGSYLDSSGFTADLENRGTVSRSMRTYVRCADAGFSATQQVVTQFPANYQGLAGGYAECPSGMYALRASAYWNNANTRNVYESAPTFDLTGWYAAGHDNVAQNALLTVAMTCVARADLPGLVVEYAHTDNPGSQFVTSTQDFVVSCPAGMTTLNGGTFFTPIGAGPDPATVSGNALASYPEASPPQGDGRSWISRSLLYPVSSAWTDVWCIPESNPVVTMLSQPTSPTSSISAQFTYTASDPAGYGFTIHCFLDGLQTQCSSSSAAYLGFDDGTHSFVVRATTSDGRSGQATSTWLVDTTAPTAQAGPLPDFVLASPARFTYAGADASGSGVANFDVRYQLAAYDGTLGPWTYPATWHATTTTSVTRAVDLGQTVCFSVRTRDLAGNVSLWTKPRCTARPLDDASLSATADWARVDAAHFWNGTATTTSTLNAQLSLATPATDRVAIVATTCPTCGDVDIKAGTADLGTINLYSARTQYRKLLEVPAFATHAGPLTIRVITGHRLVQIDGIGTTAAGG